MEQEEKKRPSLCVIFLSMCFLTNSTFAEFWSVMFQLAASTAQFTDQIRSDQIKTIGSPGGHSRTEGIGTEVCEVNAECTRVFRDLIPLPLSVFIVLYHSICALVLFVI